MGMLGEFSHAPLRSLIEHGAQVCGVVIPRPARGSLGPVTAEPCGSPIRRPLPTGTPRLAQAATRLPNSLPVLPSPVAPNIVTLAEAQSIPVVEVARLSVPETLTTLSGFHPDVICVACFPQVFPAALLAVPPLGCLNLHPSLLPAYRGPAPLFWQFRQGETRTGVTIHFMDEGVDTGDIVLQRPVTLPDGISGAEADRLCSEAGAELMVEAVQRLERDRRGCPRTKQPEEGISYYSWPAQVDFRISTERPARRAFNFMRGAAEWGVPFAIQVGDEPIRARYAISFSPDEILGAAWRQAGEQVWVQCAPGVLCATIARPVEPRDKSAV